MLCAISLLLGFPQVFSLYVLNRCFIRAHILDMFLALHPTIIIVFALFYCMRISDVYLGFIFFSALCTFYAPSDSLSPHHIAPFSVPFLSSYHHYIYP